MDRIDVRKGALKRSASMTALLVSAMTVSLACAEPRHFSVEAGMAGKALNEFARQADVSVVYTYDAVEGFKTNNVTGDYEPEEALKRMVSGSGLSVFEGAGGAFAVRVAGQAEASGEVAVEKAAGSQTSDVRGSISGHVAVINTGRPLAGALVKIIETGQSTKTDNLGRFRFPSVVPGSYTLSISYLGFASKISEIDLGKAEDFSEEYSLGQPVGMIDEIVVFGSRSARAIALNLQRTAENSSDVVSADDLGNFTGTTFAEALRRVAGISFQRDSLTGDGTNIVVRGLEPDMNAVKLNGLNLPVGNGTGRSADLSSLLADSISKITIHKTLLPSHDSAGTGGLVEIETKSPLSRPHRYANLLVEGGLSGKDFSDDFLVSGTVAGTFGSEENFGLSASVQYRKRSVRNISYGASLSFGQYLPLDGDGLPTVTESGEVHPQLNFPFEAGAADVYPSRLETSFNHVETSTLAMTLSGEWQIEDHTNLKLDIQHSVGKKTQFSLTDIFASGIDYINPPGGEDRYELSLDLTPGNESIMRNQQYNYDSNAEDVTDTYSFQGKTMVGKWEFDYLLGYAHGTEKHPEGYRLIIRTPESDALAEYFLAEATDPDAGRIISPFNKRTGNGIPLPLLSEAGWAFVNDASGYTIDTGAGGELDVTNGSNDRYTASFSAKYDFDQKYLKYIEAGVYYEDVEFISSLRRTQFGGGVLISSLGLVAGPSDLSRIGITSSGFDVISEDTLKDFVGNIDQLVADHADFTFTPIVPNEDAESEFTKEESFAAYLQGRVDIGKLEIIGGARFNRVKIEASNLTFPSYIGPLLNGGFGFDAVFQNEFTRLASQSVVATDILPRILFNYRENDNLVFRGGVLYFRCPSAGCHAVK